MARPSKKELSPLAQFLRRLTSPLVNSVLALLLTSFIAGTSYFLFEANDDLKRLESERETLTHMDELDRALLADLAEIGENVGTLNELLSESDELAAVLLENQLAEELPGSYMQDSMLWINRTLFDLHEKQGRGRGQAFEEDSLVQVNDLYLDLIAATIEKLRAMRALTWDWASLPFAERNRQNFAIIDWDNRVYSAALGINVSLDEVKASVEANQQTREQRAGEITELERAINQRRTLSVLQIVAGVVLLGLVVGAGLSRRST